MRIQLQKNDENQGLQFVKNHFEKKAGKTNSFFAGNSNLTITDKIEQKREQAKKQAMKVLRDQYASDAVTDQDLENRRTHMDQLSSEMKERHSQIQEMKAENEKLMEDYGVAADSTEQKDLELLEKQMSREDLTEDEQKRLQEMGPLTEYQQRALGNYADIHRYTKENQESQKEIHSEGQIISTTIRENVKNTGMLKAEDQAESIMDAASSEIISMLTSDLQEKIDEEAAKVREEAQKKAEEKEEEEKKLAEKKAEEQQAEGADKKDIWNTNPTTSTVQEIPSLDEQNQKVQMEIQQILNQQKLLGEDIKGIGVDVVS